MRRPNVVFIMADQMKAKASHLYWDVACPTPSLERMSQEGVRFEYAITPHPLCVPARTAVMASRYPHSLGTRRNEMLMPAGANHVFRIWKEAGFRTGLIGKNHCFEQPQDLGLFDVYCEIGHGGLPSERSTKGMEWVRPIESVDAAHAVRRDMQSQNPRFGYAISSFPLEDYGTGLIAGQTVRFLEENRDQPFALWVSFPDPHTPYEAPKKYADMFPPEDVVLPPWRSGEFDERSPERNRILNQMLGIHEDSEEETRGMIAVYHAMVRFVDDGVGKILDALERLGLRENTIVVFTADHGDFVGEHRMTNKGGVFYDCLTRVPLVLSWPGGATTDSVDDSMVSTIDIAPTLLHLQNLEIPPEMQGTPLPTTTTWAPRDAAFSEYGGGGPPFRMSDLERQPKPYGRRALMRSLQWREAEGRRKMVRTRKWKYVHDPMGDLDELYDLENDPWELENVAAEPAREGVVADMVRHLADWSISTEGSGPAVLPDREQYEIS